MLLQDRLPSRLSRPGRVASGNEVKRLDLLEVEAVAPPELPKRHVVYSGALFVVGIIIIIIITSVVVVVYFSLFFFVCVVAQREKLFQLDYFLRRVVVLLSEVDGLLVMTCRFDLDGKDFAVGEELVGRGELEDEIFFVF